MRIIFTQNQRTRLFAGLMEGWFAPGSSVLDLGSGSSHLTHHLQQCGHRVVPVDIRNTSQLKHIQPILYDGRHLPFGRRTFDYCLLSTILHHTPAPEQVIQEAARVARNLVVIEDIYSTPLERWAAVAGCSLSNWQFRGHPHANKSDAGWRETFGALGLELQEARYIRYVYTVIPFCHGAYLLRVH